jgi:putative transposase
VEAAGQAQAGHKEKFVSIPHAMLVEMLTYKAELAGINVVLQEESCTSKCSFLDGEFPEKGEQYAGRRIKRGLFQAADGRLINADVNAAYNIITKAFPKAIEGIEGVVVHPERVMLSQTE